MLAIASIRTRPSGSPALADHHTHKPREGQRSVVRSEERRPRLHRRVVRVADSSRWRAGSDRRCRSVRRRVVHVDIVMTTVRRSVLTMHPFEVCQPQHWGGPCCRCGASRGNTTPVSHCHSVLARVVRVNVTHDCTERCRLWSAAHPHGRCCSVRTGGSCCANRGRDATKSGAVVVSASPGTKSRTRTSIVVGSMAEPMADARRS